MSRWAPYAAVGTVGILVAGFALWFAGDANDGIPSKSVSPQDRTSEVTSMVAREFAIEGMMCQGCVDTLTSALTKIPGVQSASVSLEHKRAVVLAEEAQVPTEKIVATIATAGYKGEFTKAAQAL
jgi:copper chaperone